MKPFVARLGRDQNPANTEVLVVGFSVNAKGTPTAVVVLPSGQLGWAPVEALWVVAGSTDFPLSGYRVEGSAA